MWFSVFDILVYWDSVFYSWSLYCIMIQDRTPGEPFVAKSAKEAEMEKMLRSMEVISSLF